MKTMNIRPTKGSMLILSGASTMMLVAFGIVVIDGIGGAMLSSRIANEVDSYCLSLALKMNSGDRIGKMNNLVAASRELVFDARQQSKMAREQYPLLRGLADEMLAESRDGARFVIDEEKNLAKAIRTELKEGAEAIQQRRNQAFPRSVAQVEVSQPRVSSLLAVDAKGVDSNVVVPMGNSELLAYDRAQGLVSEEGAVYKSRQRMPLPDQDSDLTFELNPLPAFNNNRFRQAHLLSGYDLLRGDDLMREPDPSNSMRIPTAISLQESTTIRLGGCEQMVKHRCNAITTGARAERL